MNRHHLSLWPHGAGGTVVGETVLLHHRFDALAMGPFADPFSLLKRGIPSISQRRLSATYL